MEFLKTIGTAIAAYAVVHRFATERYDRLSKQALADRASVTRVVSTASVSDFLFALANFAPVQNAKVPQEPFYWAFWTWYPIPTYKGFKLPFVTGRLFSYNGYNMSITPNKQALWSWIRDALDVFPQDTNDPEKYRLDLRRANLKGADLHEVNLSYVNLSGVDLQGTNLRGANLQGANLVKANLQGAILIDANLHEANLSAAELQRCYLNNANLRASILRRAKLNDADLSHADLRWANLRMADISGAIFTDVNACYTDCDGVNAEGTIGKIPEEMSNAGQIKYRIGVSHQNKKHPFTDVLEMGIAKAEQKFDICVKPVYSSNDAEIELSKVKEMLDDIDCLAIDPVLENATKAIEAANLAGIPVIQFNVKANGGSSVTFAGSEQAESGELLGEWLVGFYNAGKAKNARIKGIYLRGAKGQVTDTARNYALKKRLKQEDVYDNIVLIEAYANYKTEEASMVTRNLLKSHPDIDFIIANNDAMILGALDAIEKYCPSSSNPLMSLKKDIALVGVDGLEDVLLLIEKKKITATVFQHGQQQGYDAIAACVAHLKGINLPKEILVKFALVQFDNYSQFPTKLNERDLKDYDIAYTSSGSVENLP